MKRNNLLYTVHGLIRTGFLTLDSHSWECKQTGQANGRLSGCTHWAVRMCVLFWGAAGSWGMGSKWFAKGGAEETRWMLWGHRTDPIATQVSEQGCSTFISMGLCVMDLTYPNLFLRCQGFQLEILPWLLRFALQLFLPPLSRASPTGYRTRQLQGILQAWALKAFVPDLSVSLTFLIILILMCGAHTAVSNYSRYDL